MRYANGAGTPAMRSRAELAAIEPGVDMVDESELTDGENEAAAVADLEVLTIPKKNS